MANKEKTFDSVDAAKARLAKLREESDQINKAEASAEEKRQEQRAVRNTAIGNADADMLEKQAYRLSDLGTRDQLLERVREMRREVPDGPPPPPPMTEFQKQQLAIEQQAGRDAVARAEKQLEEARAWREKAAAETRAREGHMAEVHHPNPGMEEQYPANKATLGKAK
jgi:hypothetical protein